MLAPPTWLLFLSQFAGSFTAPGRQLFDQLLTAWVLCPGRHTLTRLWSVIPEAQRRQYGAYARWVRCGRWSMDTLWRQLLLHLVARWVPEGHLTLVLDDTLMKKSGSKINGAGNFRDAVHSTHARPVLTLRVVPPWGGEPLALPVLVRLHRKGGANMIQLAIEMIEQVAQWLPERDFCVVTDGAYAPLIRCSLPRTIVVSRMRRNAAVYEPPPPRTGMRGRPRKKGRRLASLPELANSVAGWARETVSIRGRAVQRDLLAREVLWYLACPDAQPAQVASAYADRWAIEDTFRNTKQFLGAEDPQSWVGPGPERVAALACWMSAAVWDWFVATPSQQSRWPVRPWYPTKRTPSFQDAVAPLRREVWTRTIFDASPHRRLSRKNATTLLDVLAEAA
ncbi:MAG: IS701 family transposase [Candidatus Dormibacteria bacterium]